MVRNALGRMVVASVVALAGTALAVRAGEAPRGGGIRAPAMPAISERQRVVEWLEQLRSPFVDERLAAVDRLSQVTDKALAAEFRITDQLVAVADDAREFERVRSQALRGLGRLRALGIAPVEIIHTILKLTAKNLAGDPSAAAPIARSERVAADTLELLVELGLGADPILTGQLKQPQSELKRAWDRVFGDYAAELEGRRVAAGTLPQLLSGRTYGRMLAAYGALSFNDTDVTTDFLADALIRSATVTTLRERHLFTTLPQRNQDPDATIGALVAMQYDMQRAFFSDPKNAGRDQTRIRELMLALSGLVKTAGQPSQHPLRMATYSFMETLAALERRAQESGMARTDGESTGRINAALAEAVYPRLETTRNDAEADAIVRIMMQRLDPKVAELLAKAALPRPAGQPQLHIRTLVRINSALTESVRQMLEVLRQPKAASAQGQEKRRESGDEVVRIGQHFIMLLTAADAPVDIRRTAASSMGFWPPQLKLLDWSDELKKDPPARPVSYQDLECMVVGALVATLSPELDPTLQNAINDSLIYLTGERFMVFDPDKLEETGPDAGAWKTWWNDAQNQQRFKPQPPARK